MSNTHALCMILVMALVTVLLRFLPFILLGNRKTPAFLEYLGKVLPFAVMAMLVVYCLKDTNLSNIAAEFISVILVVLVHLRKRNTLLSIILGTACYMILIRIV